jgi:hypothetical protein
VGRSSARKVLTLGGPIDSTTFFKFSGELEYSNYEFDHLDAFGFADVDGPDDVYSIDLRPSFVKYLTPNFSVYGGVIFGAGGEAGADVGEALYYGGFAGFSYQVQPGLWLGAGVGVSTQLEDDPFIVPLVTLDWTINDRLKLEATGTRGLLTYKVNDQWSTFVEARYIFRQFRLDDDAVVSGGVLTDESLPVGVGVTYAPSDHLSFTVTAGGVFWRTIKLTDDGNHDLVDEDADVTAYVGLSGKYSF